jgi:FtsH-binding integral membrane protein
MLPLRENPESQEESMQHAHARPIPGAVATAGANERVTFLRKTYAHLGGAIALFVLLEAWLLNSGIGLAWAQWALGTSWLLVLGLFIGVSWLAERWARSDTSRGMQYLGLGLYTVAEAFIFAPILIIASYAFEGPIITQAAVITLLLFGGLTATVFLTKKDFSFLRGILFIGSLVALGTIVLSLLFGFNTGVLFTVAMIALAAGYILFHTSQVMAHYPPTHYVAAALALFSSVALLFWYVLRLLMSRD